MGIREQIKQVLTRGCEKQYERELGRRKVTYQQWLAEGKDRQTLNGTPYASFEREVGSSGQCTDGGNSGQYVGGGDAEIVLIQSEDGLPVPDAKEIFEKYFALHPQILLAYCDEDVLDNAVDMDSGRDVADSGCTESEDPWFKPDWSPDTFLSEPYFGGLVAVRRSWLDTLSGKEELLPLIIAAGGFEKGCCSIGHVPAILFHSRKKKPDRKKGIDSKNSLIISEKNTTVYEEEGAPLVSVIIPSKDHPEILQQGLESLYRTTGKTSCEALYSTAGKTSCEALYSTVGKTSYEVLVVDNGSSQENRQRIEALLREAPVPVTYLYEPMDFDFSAMCNLGAKKATGKYLLFLNDDVEMRCDGWMEHMIEKAAAEYAGAVGMKLYYPDSVRIQHAGIVNLPMGPVHKLQFLEDTQDYYDHYQMVNRNVLAVTGACLMVHRDKYWEAGGMSSELPVAFNDVDLCYRLWELGYHNVICNTIYGWHHESLSRGDDESPQKLQRLLGEKAKLYARHPGLKEGKDPYYSVHLNREGLDTRIRPAYMTAGNRVQISTPVEKQLSLDQYRRDNCLLYRVERCEEECIQGYGVVLGDNNACYHRELILWKSEEKCAEEPTGQISCFTVPLEGQYRPELVENMPDQKNVALCGFWWKPEAGSLPEGRYRLGMTACSKIGGTKLINWSNHVLVIEE